MFFLLVLKLCIVKLLCSFSLNFSSEVAVRKLAIIVHSLYLIRLTDVDGNILLFLPNSYCQMFHARILIIVYSD